MITKRKPNCLALAVLTLLFVLLSVIGASASSNHNVDLVAGTIENSIVIQSDGKTETDISARTDITANADSIVNIPSDITQNESVFTERVFHLPAGLLEIADDAFDDDWNVTITGEENTVAEDYAVSKGFNWQPLIGPSVFHLPKNLQYIGDEAFVGTMAEAVILPDTVDDISDRAFADMPRLMAINIPESVILIGDEIFDCQQQVMIFGSTNGRASRYAATAGLPFVPVNALLPDIDHQLLSEQYGNANRVRRDGLTNVPTLQLNIKPTEIAVGDINTYVYNRCIAFYYQGRSPPLFG